LFLSVFKIGGGESFLRSKPVEGRGLGVGSAKGLTSWTGEKIRVGAEGGLEEVKAVQESELADSLLKVETACQKAPGLGRWLPVLVLGTKLIVIPEDLISNPGLTRRELVFPNP
jgi:hypothetical protein